MLHSGRGRFTSLQHSLVTTSPTKSSHPCPLTAYFVVRPTKRLVCRYVLRALCTLCLPCSVGANIAPPPCSESSFVNSPLLSPSFLLFSKLEHRAQNRNKIPNALVSVVPRTGRRHRRCTPRSCRVRTVRTTATGVPATSPRSNPAPPAAPGSCGVRPCRATINQLTVVTASTSMITMPCPDGTSTISSGTHCPAPAACRATSADDTRCGTTTTTAACRPG